MRNGIPANWRKMSGKIDGGMNVIIRRFRSGADGCGYLPRQAETSPLTIAGERKSEKEEKGRKDRRTGRARGNFMPSFSLPEALKADKVSAESKDGALHVRLPKDESAEPESAEITVT